MPKHVHMLQTVMKSHVLGKNVYDCDLVMLDFIFARLVANPKEQSMNNPMQRQDGVVL